MCEATITFERNDLWPRCLTRCFNWTLSIIKRKSIKRHDFTYPYYSAPIAERSIVISLSVCLSVCLALLARFAFSVEFSSLSRFKRSLLKVDFSSKLDSRGFSVLVFCVCSLLLRSLLPSLCYLVSRLFLCFLCSYVLLGFRKCSYSAWLSCSPMFLLGLLVFIVFAIVK